MLQNRNTRESVWFMIWLLLMSNSWRQISWRTQEDIGRTPKLSHGRDQLCVHRCIDCWNVQNMFICWWCHTGGGQWGYCMLWLQRTANRRTHRVFVHSCRAGCQPKVSTARSNAWWLGCDCCGRGIVEMKCPYTYWSMHTDSKFYLQCFSDKLKLDPKHK